MGDPIAAPVYQVSPIMVTVPAPNFAPGCEGFDYPSIARAPSFAPAPNACTRT